MTCKIKGAVLYDETFMKSFSEFMEGISLPYLVAFKMYKLGNELGLAFKDLDEKKQAIIEKHAVKNSKGRFKEDSNGNFIFRDKRKVEDEVINMLNSDVELNCDLLDLKDLEVGMIKPALIHSIAMLNPIILKED